jgi:hypothetical protein
LPKVLNPGFCYFVPQIDGIHAISSIGILEIKDLLFYASNFDKITSLSKEFNQVAEHRPPASPVTSVVSSPSITSTPQHSGRRDFVDQLTPNRLSITSPSINSTPQKRGRKKKSLDLAPAPQVPTTLELNDANSTPRKRGRKKACVPHPILDTTFEIPPMSTGTPPVTTRPEQVKKTPPQPPPPRIIIQDTSIEQLDLHTPTSTEPDSKSQSLQFLQEKQRSYSEVSWTRGLRRGMRAHIPREEVQILEEHFETLGWKISFDLKRSVWWSKEKSYLPPWSPLIEEPERVFLSGIDIFWSLDDSLKYLSLYGNSAPCTRKKGRGLNSLRINLLEDSHQEYFLSLLEEPDPDTQFSAVWKSLKSSGWKILHIPSTLFSLPVQRIAIPFWTSLTSDCVELDSLSRLKLNQDYFLHVQHVINYLKNFGNTQVLINAIQEKQIGTNESGFPLFPLPGFDAHGKEDPLDLTEKRFICKIVQASKFDALDLSLLETFGWDFSKRKKLSIIFSPWGSKKFVTESKLEDLESNFDYFANANEVLAFLRLTGACRIQPIRVYETTTSQLSVCSPSVNSEEEIIIESSTEEDEAVPLETVKILEKKLNDAIRSSGDNYLFPIISPILHKLGWKFHTRTCGPLESGIIFSPWGWELFLTQQKNNLLLHGRDYFVENNEVVTYVRKHQNRSCSDLSLKATYPRRALAGSAKTHASEIILKTWDPKINPPIVESFPEKDLRAKPKAPPSQPKQIETMIPTKAIPSRPKQTEKAIPDTPAEDLYIPNPHFKYNFSGQDLAPHLAKIGLEGQLKHALNAAGDNYSFSLLSPILLELGWNFHFRHPKNRMTVNLAPWANSLDTDSWALGVDYFLEPRDICNYLMKHGHRRIEGAVMSSRKRPAIITPKPVPAPPKVKKVKAAQKPKVKSDARHVGVEDVTLSQVQVMEQQVDPHCSSEIRELLEKAVISRPRLNLNKFDGVWEVLSGHNWRMTSCPEGTLYCRPSGEGSNSFKGESDVLEFIKEQIIARGHNHTTLIDRATFTPLGSYPDEADMFDLPELEEEDSSDDEDDEEELNDIPSPGSDNALLDALLVFGNGTCETPVATSNVQKRKEHPDHGSEGLQVDLDAEMEPKRPRIEEPQTISPSQLFDKIALAIQNLSPSHTPSTILGREQEYQQILETLHHMILTSSGSLRISGLHGQGKTMTTKFAIHSLTSSDLQLVWLSATEQSSLRDIVKLIPSNGPPSPNTTSDPHLILKQILQSARTPILVVIDEIDILQPKIREYLVAISNAPGSNLLLIGLANNILPESFHSSITFEPYDETTLSVILNSLSDHLFEEKSLTLISKTYASKGEPFSHPPFSLTPLFLCCR